MCMCSIAMDANRNEAIGTFVMQSQHKLSSGSEMKQQGAFLLLRADLLHQSLMMLRRSSTRNVKKNRNFPGQSTALHLFERACNQSPVAAGSHSRLCWGRWSPLFSGTTPHVTRKWWRICIPSKLLQHKGCWRAAVRHLYHFCSREAFSRLQKVRVSLLRVADFLINGYCSYLRQKKGRC